MAADEHPAPAGKTTAQKIAKVLREEIQRGDYKPGQRLPSTSDLVSRFKTSTQTVQNAFDQLKLEGLVVGVQRKGFYVRQLPDVQRIARRRYVFRDRIGYYFDEAAQGYRLVATPTVRVVPVSAEIARRLNIEPGSQVVKRSRVLGEVEPEPQGLQWAVSYLPAWLLAELPVVGATDTGFGGIYDRIEEHFDQPLLWEDVQGAVAASDEEVAVLDGVVHGGPLVRILRTASLPDGRPVEVNDTRMDGARFEVVAVLERDASAAWPPKPAVEIPKPPGK